MSKYKYKKVLKIWIGGRTEVLKNTNNEVNFKSCITQLRHIAQADLILWTSVGLRVTGFGPEGSGVGCPWLPFGEY